MIRSMHMTGMRWQSFRSSAFWLAAIMAASAPFHICAQEPEAAAETCARADYESSRTERDPRSSSIGRHIAEPAISAPSCWVEWSNVAEIAGAHVYWVDVRSSEGWKQSPLPGTIQVSAARIFDKNFLREERLVLVGAGYDSQRIARLCVQLRNSGFLQVFALDGGSRSWVESGRIPTEGGAAAPDEIKSLDFAAELAESAWKVLAIDLDASEMDALFDVSAGTNVILEAIDLETNLRIVSQKNAQSPHQQIILIAKDEAAQSRLKRRLPKLPKNMYWLQGGMVEYKKYRREQANVVVYADRNTRKPCGAP